jgi:hypothetical protein
MSIPHAFLAPHHCFNHIWLRWAGANGLIDARPTAGDRLANGRGLVDTGTHPEPNPATNNDRLANGRIHVDN